MNPTLLPFAVETSVCKFSSMSYMAVLEADGYRWMGTKEIMAGDNSLMARRVRAARADISYSFVGEQ